MTDWFLEGNKPKGVNFDLLLRVLRAFNVDLGILDQFGLDLSQNGRH